MGSKIYTFIGILYCIYCIYNAYTVYLTTTFSVGSLAYIWAEWVKLLWRNQPFPLRLRQYDLRKPEFFVLCASANWTLVAPQLGTSHPKGCGQICPEQYRVLVPSSNGTIFGSVYWVLHIHDHSLIFDNWSLVFSSFNGCQLWSPPIPPKSKV